MNIVLIHGAYHGPWCWDRLRPELERAGHGVTAVELPIDDPAAGSAAYAQAVVEQAPWTDPPVLVAHSMGGLVAPLVAAERPVGRLVFLAAFLPESGVSANEQRRSEGMDPPFAPSTAEWIDLGHDVWRVGPNTAREIFFHDVPEEVASWAVAQLRPQCYRVMNEPSPLSSWPPVPASYIVCRDDHALNPEWGRRAARERLGVEAVEVDGGHSPMLTRPAELAALIERAVSGAA